MFVFSAVGKLAFAQQTLVDEILPQLSQFEQENEERVDILLRLANAYLFVSPQRSEEIGQEAKTISSRINYAIGSIKSNLLIGRSLQFRGNVVNDILFFTEAASLAHEHEQTGLIADIHRNMGEHYLFIGEYAQALSNLQTAIEFAEKQEDMLFVAASNFSLGNFFLKTDKLEEAEKYFVKAAQIFEDIGDQRGMSVSIGSLGEIYQKQGRYEEAISHVGENIEIFLARGDHLSLAETYRIMGRIEMEMGNVESAMEHLDNALIYAESAEDLNQKILILIDQGNICITSGQYEMAKEALSEALTISQALAVKENEMNSHDAFARLYKATGNLEKSLFHLEAYNVIRDQLYPTSYGQDLLQIQNRFEAERQESELNSLRRIKAESDLEKERNSSRLNTAIAAIMFVLMVVGVMGLRYNAKAQTAKQMSLHNRQLLEIGKELEHVNRVKSDFLANTSHEIRTPLNGILGMVTLLSQSKTSKTQKEQIRAIELSGKKLLVLVNDLLDLTKIEAGKIEIVYAPMNIADVLAPELSFWEEVARSEGLDFKVEMSADIPYKLTGASARIIQVLTNLVANSVKFTEQGSITVRVFIEKDFGQEVLVHFEVEDTGIGIPEDQLVDLFERFSQIDSGMTRSFEGTGLGLAISRDLVRIMNGSIGVSSVEGKGSKFWFRLPMSINHRKRPRNEQGVIEKPLSRSNGPLALNVLVAEDNAINQAVIKGMLEHLGHKANFANNGKEVIEKAMSNKPDVILMDIQMPVMDGEQATKEIRGMDGHVSLTPIVAITANAMAGDAEKFIEIGMDAYLAKPVNIDSLQRVLLDMKSVLELRRSS